MTTALHSNTQNMAESELDETRQPPKRVFINNIDSYSSKYIAEFLSECGFGTAAEEEETERDDGLVSNRNRSFHVVGTVNKYDEDGPYVVEQYLKPERNELLSKLMSCDVVIYNITQHADQIDEACWALYALHKGMEHFSGPKIFILISTVMTWACSKPVDPEDPTLPLTDELFWRRKPHPNFKQHIDLEKRVVKLGKTNKAVFSTYVVASGFLYGKGEHFLHYFFKTSWLGKERAIPVFGDGSNVVPLIHISDLASVIQNVIHHPPWPYYLLAVDSSNSTMEEIVKTIASALGPGKIQKKPIEEAFLIQDLSMCNSRYAVSLHPVENSQKVADMAMEIDSMQVNLRMDGVHVKELSIRWLCESGLVENIEMVVEEYRQTRQLLPIRLCLLGPPAVGKSTVSKKICKHYNLHHITLKETVSETISQLEDAVNNSDPDAENEDSVQDSKMLLDSLRDSMQQNGGFLEDNLLVKVMKDRLMSNPYKNQGFVLDNIPETREQATELFSAEENGSEDSMALISSFNKMIMPEFVFCLDASDDFLKERVMNLPDKLVSVQNYEQEQFLQLLAQYRGKKFRNETALEYFDEMDIPTVHLEITSNDKPDSIPVIQKIFETVGQPRNYGPSTQDRQEEKRKEDEEKIRKKAQEIGLSSSEETRKRIREGKQRAECWEDWMKGLQKVRQQEDEVLEAQAVPVRNYLMEHVMPTLTQGLIECCKARPQDPVDFLAEFLLWNNPLNY